MEMYPSGWRVRIRNPLGAARRAGVQIPPSPPQKYGSNDTNCYRTFLFFCRRSPYIKQFSEYGGAKVLNARIFYFTEDELLIFCFAPPNEKNQKVDRP